LSRFCCADCGVDFAHDASFDAADDLAPGFAFCCSPGGVGFRSIVVARADDRKVLNGIYWRLRTGSPWADIPERYGPATTCYNRFVRWRKIGVWDRIFEALSKAYRGELQMIDSSSIRVHQHAANVKKGGRKTPTSPRLGTSLQPDAWATRAAD